jgi:hypothetical protein
LKKLVKQGLGRYNKKDERQNIRPQFKLHVPVLSVKRKTISKDIYA